MSNFVMPEWAKALVQSASAEVSTNNQVGNTPRPDHPRPAEPADPTRGDAPEVQHFKCGSDSNTHRAWCTSCNWQLPSRTGRSAASYVRRKARDHVRSTGHDVRIDVTRQHGYTLQREEGEEAP